jgi:hypothetical protein
MQPRSLCRRRCSASKFVAPEPESGSRLSGGSMPERPLRSRRELGCGRSVAEWSDERIRPGGRAAGKRRLCGSDPSARAARGHERDRRLGTCHRRNRGRPSRRAAGRDECSRWASARFARSRLGGLSASNLAADEPGRTRLEPRSRLRRGYRRSSAGRARRGHHKPDAIARREPAVRCRGRRGPAGAAAGRRHARRRRWTRPARAAAPRPGGT